MYKEIRQQIEVFGRYKSLLNQLVIRDIKVRYRRSFLGLIWTILNPLLMMIVISTVFSNIFKMSIDNFPVYVLIGNIVFSFNSDATSQALYSILGNGSLIRKVYIPKYLFPLSKVISCSVNLGFSFISLIIVMIITGAPFHMTIITAWIPFIYIFIFSLGLSLILSSINVYFRDVGHLYGVILTAWVYITPIFYSADIIPEDIRQVINFNPMYHYITFFRQIIMEGTFPSMQANIICFLIAINTLILGGFVFWKLQDRFILHI